MALSVHRQPKSSAFQAAAAFRCLMCPACTAARSCRRPWAAMYSSTQRMYCLHAVGQAVPGGLLEDGCRELSTHHGRLLSLMQKRRPAGQLWDTWLGHVGMHTRLANASERLCHTCCGLPHAHPRLGAQPHLYMMAAWG
jgi:hypothetical protein